MFCSTPFLYLYDVIRVRLSAVDGGRAAGISSELDNLAYFIEEPRHLCSQNSRKLRATHNKSSLRALDRKGYITMTSRLELVLAAKNKLLPQRIH